MSNEPGIHIYYCNNAVPGGRKPEALAKLEASGCAAAESVPCGGRIDPRYILKAFEAGARAVCVLACPVGHCRSLEGNLRLARRAEFARELLREAGMNPQSVRVFLPSGLDENALSRELEALTQFVGEFERTGEVAA